MELSRRSTAAGFCEAFAKCFAGGLPRDTGRRNQTVARVLRENCGWAAKMSTAAYGCQPGDFCRELVIVRAL
jgi:hypothetical protein